MRWSTLQKAAYLAAPLLVSVPLSRGYNLQPDDPQNIKDIAADIAEDMMTFYQQIMVAGAPGDLKPPYYWWEAGALMNVLIDYWKLTGNDKYNDDIMAGLVHQAGKYYDYMPDNQTLTEGNDDQGFWGMAVLAAAELGFEEPMGNTPNWLTLSQAVFNTQAARWDTEHCNGGLRWQIFAWNNGYDYKNTISQGCFFNMAARLALYTGNNSYIDWAEKTWDWVIDKKFIDDNYNVFDGAYISTDCTELTPYQWTYNNGVFMLGAAALYNLTGSDTWKQRLDSLINGSSIFFKGDNHDIMTEVACETVQRCNYDQQSFKAYLTRWMASVTLWAPYTAETIKPLLRATSIAAASQCVGGNNGRLCGLQWFTGKYDGTSGMGMQMAALEAILTNLIDTQPAPLTAHTGGTSKGDYNAGNDDGRAAGSVYYGPIGHGSRVGAGFLTFIIIGCVIAEVLWLLKDEALTLKEFFSGAGLKLNKGDLSSPRVPATSGVYVMEKAASGPLLSPSSNSPGTQSTPTANSSPSNDHATLVTSPEITTVQPAHSAARQVPATAVAQPHVREAA